MATCYQVALFSSELDHIYSFLKIIRMIEIRKFPANPFLDGWRRKKEREGKLKLTGSYLVKHENQGQDKVIHQRSIGNKKLK